MSRRGVKRGAFDRQSAGSSASPLLLDLVRILARQAAREALAAEHASPVLNMETNDAEA